MNRKNACQVKGGGQSAPSIRWAKANQDEWAGGLGQPGYIGDAGFDMYVSRTVTVEPHALAMVPTNIKIALPRGYWGMIVGRSSTFMKRQLLVQTAIIDNGYRGELWCMVRNMSDQSVTIPRKDRVAQLILFRLETPGVEEVADLPPSDRGEKGFGSTGINVVEG